MWIAQVVFDVMEVFDASEVIRKSVKNPVKRFPARYDHRCQRVGELVKDELELLVPRMEGAMPIQPGSKVFTIGSCFARSVEKALSEIGDFLLPTRKFSTPNTESPNAPNDLLNEYNPGSMAQRIGRAMDGLGCSTSAIAGQGEECIDLLLPGGSVVTYDRLMERRAEIDAIYSELPTSDTLILTLGLIESWFDVEDGLYLNRMPPFPVVEKNPGRFKFVRFDVDSSYELLGEAISRVEESEVSNLFITVSPVPLQTTFFGGDAIISNSYSKSVLRVCAERLVRDFAFVSYFPSFEIVSSGGLSSFVDDNVHVKDCVVAHIMRGFLTKPNVFP
ncbi:GSCFA domain-containing protein [Microbulbifer sp. SA54]|uniref:GSCFA domain-containing protein n=1 Tax=Microbulbifer sp. SA54 TaxID=3401577 RepID=UPI003AAE2B92